MVLVLGNRTARAAACVKIHAAPDGWVMRLTEPTRSLEQNALLHAELSEVADKLEWAGEKQDIETWKRLLTAAWMRATGQKVTLLPAVDGHGFDILYRRTSTLSKSELSELISYIAAWKADREEFDD